MHICSKFGSPALKLSNDSVGTVLLLFSICLLCDLEKQVKVTHHRTRPRSSSHAYMVQIWQPCTQLKEHYCAYCVIHFCSVTLKSRSRSLIIEIIQDLHERHIWSKFGSSALNLWKVKVKVTHHRTNLRPSPGAYVVQIWQTCAQPVISYCELCVLTMFFSSLAM